MRVLLHDIDDKLCSLNPLDCGELGVRRELFTLVKAADRTGTR